ncbi:MAG: hypothetical protein GY869_14640 [Planctomycetes bacterium]|nr:hypothetical protein [Planctomycetota bacterium]
MKRLRIILQALYGIVLIIFLSSRIIAAGESLSIGDGYSLTTDDETAVTLTGDWTNYGFFQGNAVFNGTTGQAIANPSGETFNELTIDNSSDQGVLLNSDITIQNTLFLLQGQLDNTEHTVTMADNAIIIHEDGELVLPPDYGGMIDLIYEGANPVTTGGEMPTDPDVLRNLTINNPGGVTLSHDISVNGNLLFQQGKLITTDDYKTTLVPDAVVNGEDNGRYLVGNLMTTRDVETAENNFGGIGVSVNPGDDDLGQVTITRVSGPAAEVEILGRMSIHRSWAIAAEHPPDSGRELNLSWLSDDDNEVDLTRAQVWRTEDGLDWINVGYTQDALQTHSVSVITNVFSVWTVNDFFTSRIPGDIDGDNAVDDFDVHLVVHYILYQTGLFPHQLVLADLIDDDLIDVQDVIRLINIMP